MTACLPELTGAWQPYMVSFGIVGAVLLIIYSTAADVAAVHAIGIATEHCLPHAWWQYAYQWSSRRADLAAHR